MRFQTVFAISAALGATAASGPATRTQAEALPQAERMGRDVTLVETIPAATVFINTNLPSATPLVPPYADCGGGLFRSDDVPGGVKVVSRAPAKLSPKAAARAISFLTAIKPEYARVSNFLHFPEWNSNKGWASWWLPWSSLKEWGSSSSFPEDQFLEGERDLWVRVRVAPGDAVTPGWPKAHPELPLGQIARDCGGRGGADVSGKAVGLDGTTWEFFAEKLKYVVLGCVESETVKCVDIKIAFKNLAYGEGVKVPNVHWKWEKLGDEPRRWYGISSTLA